VEVGDIIIAKDGESVGRRAGGAEEFGTDGGGKVTLLFGERCKIAGLVSIRSSPTDPPSSYFLFLERGGGVGINRESDNPRGRIGEGNTRGDS
jgi:hypothetical protein